MLNKEIFISRLKEARERKKLTLKELAELCGISLSAMNRYAALTSMPSLEVTASIADALEVSIDWLCGKDEPGNLLQCNTAGDLLRLLSTLLTTQVREVETRNTPTTTIVGGSVFGATINDEAIIIQKDRVPDHLGFSFDFPAWRKLIELLRDGAIDEEMYNAWIEKKANQLDSTKLPYNTKYYNGPIDVDGLPF